MALTREVVDIVIQEAAAAGATQVSAVHVTIGYMRDIVEEYFEGLFGYLTRGTVAENAELIMTRVAFTVLCNKCGQIYRFDAHDRSAATECPSCGETDFKVNTGREFFINAIEIVRVAQPNTEKG
jgi:hydrogenase nickel incorporation protein HypA/HybF